MLRSVTLGIALSVLAAACAVVEQPVPAGTTPVQAQIRNNTGHPAEIIVLTPTGPLQGAAQPGSVPAGVTADVTLYLPLGQDYVLGVGGVHRLGRGVNGGLDGVDVFARRGCRLDIEIASDGFLGMKCLQTP